jgi:hypothetical protein
MSSASNIQTIHIQPVSGGNEVFTFRLPRSYWENKFCQLKKLAVSLHRYFISG